MYAPHLCFVLRRKVPAPSQVWAGVNVEPVQDWPTQTVPTVYLRQAPGPSQVPSRPQLADGSCVHSLSGSVPPSTGRQRPSAAVVFAAVHAMQLPAQADSQQTPATQAPVEHCAELEQAAP